ncbi:MAG: HAD-IIIA family hydrolase [Marinilabiliales bacterium]|nr:HAD-IIIA family hydrolase [Marinilabiliales bacterium]
MAKHPAIFLDRDGTIIEDNDYIKNTSDIVFFPYTFKALKLLQKQFLLFVITNQSGISKGMISDSEVQEVNKYITEFLKTEGITILDTFYCPHKNEDDCICKKPRPYFLKKAAQLYNVDLPKSFIVGDHPSDVECGINAGVTPIYLLSGHGKKHKDELVFNSRICKNLSDASRFIMSTI